MEDEANAGAVAASPKPKRKYQTLQEKVSLCIQADLQVKAQKKMSWKAFCREHDVDPSQLRRWTKNLIKMKQALENTTKKKSKKATMPGRLSR
jgi:hypothetical protein